MQVEVGVAEGGLSGKLSSMRIMISTVRLIIAHGSQHSALASYHMLIIVIIVIIVITKTPSARKKEREGKKKGKKKNKKGGLGRETKADDVVGGITCRASDINHPKGYIIVHDSTS